MTALIIFLNSEVLLAQIEAYKTVFIDACNNVDKIDIAMGKYFGPYSQITQENGNN